MAYHIEVLAIKPELYAPIKAAADKLNQVQKQFFFDLPPKRLEDALYLEKADKYLSTDVWEWVKAFRIKAGGDRKYTIVVVDGPLRSAVLGNLFGSNNNVDMISVFTVDHFVQYMPDLVRYCRYYFVRYALGFLQPTLKSHNEDARKSCMLHKKIIKDEIRASLNSGKLCAACREIIKPKLNNEYNDAVDKMLLVVSNKYPYALVIKGGGVKGLAFIGALIELEKHFTFDMFAGTSAGAIVAILLGAGYTPSELKEILEEKDFKDFTDASFFGGILNLVIKHGFYPGDTFEKWMADLIKEKFPKKLTDPMMKELPYRTIVYASRRDIGRINFDSNGDRMDSLASFAARCSMSIPFFFKPCKVDNFKVYDGGLRTNFPLEVFRNTFPEKPVIGLYLTGNYKKKGAVLFDIANIAIDGEERKIVEENLDKTVVIDPRPISTTDFNLNNMKKTLLLLSGKLGALKFMQANHLDIHIEQIDIDALSAEIKEIRKKMNYKE